MRRRARCAGRRRMLQNATRHSHPMLGTGFPARPGAGCRRTARCHPSSEPTGAASPQHPSATDRQPCRAPLARTSRLGQTEQPRHRWSQSNQSAASQRRWRCAFQAPTAAHGQHIQRRHRRCFPRRPAGTHCLVGRSCQPRWRTKTRHSAAPGTRSRSRALHVDFEDTDPVRAIASNRPGDGDICG